MSIKDASPPLLPSTEGILQSLTSWPVVMGQSLMLSCFYQWELLLACQRALVVAQRECEDQWICRFGGGVPLDG